MSCLAPLFGMPVAFKLGTVLGVFLLPLLVYASFRLMRLAFPAPLLGASAALVFLYLEDNPIWGGTIASTLTGEFSYTYGVGFAVLFLGVAFRAHADGRGPWAPAAVLALTSYAHGYAVLWAGLTASALLLSGGGRGSGGAARGRLGDPPLAGGGGGARLRLRRAGPLAAARGLGLHHPLRRRLDRGDGPRSSALAARAAPPGGCARARGHARPTRDRGPRRRAPRASRLRSARRARPWPRPARAWA